MRFPNISLKMEVVQAVSKRAQELGIDHVVVASNSGQTALKFWQGLQGTKTKLVCVSPHAGFSGGDEIRLNEDIKKEMENEGINMDEADTQLIYT